MNPLDPKEHAKARLIELLMAVKGRSEPSPVAYRRSLELMTLEQVNRIYDDEVGGITP